MKFVFVPDSFKGTLSSREVCDTLGVVAKEIFSDCEIVSVPVADGGEGSLDVFYSLGGYEKKEVITHNSLMELKSTHYLLGGDVAIVELATCAGLPEIYDRRNPSLTTTYGVGEQIADAIKCGAKKIIIALGGSSTNDGGVGIACALGAKFIDVFGREFLPTGGTLENIVAMDVTALEEIRNEVEFLVMCDVETVLTGESGASAVYGKQKGAKERDIIDLDNGLEHLNKLLFDEYGKDFSTIVGGGAAGGAGAGICAFLGGRLSSGIEIVLDIVDFEDKIKDCDYVITGEGKFDSQSLMGKVISGVSERTKEKNKKLVVIAGLIKDVEDKDLEKLGICKTYATNPDNKPFEEVKGRAKEDLIFTAKRMFQEIKGGLI